jgi:hypothetical protein
MKEELNGGLSAKRPTDRFCIASSALLERRPTKDAGVPAGGTRDHASRTAGGLSFRSAGRFVAIQRREHFLYNREIDGLGQMGIKPGLESPELILFLAVAGYSD